jgi:hypothetical protein
VTGGEDRREALRPAGRTRTWPGGSPKLVKAYFWSRVQQSRFFRVVEAAFTGCWLALLSSSDLDAVDDVYYVGSGPGTSPLDYQDPSYNRQGLFEWERRAVEEFFPPGGIIGVLGAGGGREVLALRQLSFRVDGWECQPDFVRSANDLLRDAGLEPTVSWVPRNTVPSGLALYDGLVVGWATYTLIRGRHRRVDLLRALRARVEPGAPLLLSFYGRSSADFRYNVAVRIGNLGRRLLGRERLEVGDYLDPNFVHQFLPDEVDAELAAGGFEMRTITHRANAYAVAVADDSRPR